MQVTDNYWNCSPSGKMSDGDTGATRITDIERNLLVVSTDLLGVQDFTIRQRSKTSVRKHNIAKQELVE